MMTNDESSPDSTSSLRILAWWDLDVAIGDFHKRKVTARPLKELERALGHRLHVESWLRYETMPEGVWKFEAFNYLETSDPALAAYVTLKQLSVLSDWFGMSWQGYNTAATASADDPDQSTICAFYWNLPDQRGLLRYKSGGVLLRLVDLSCAPFDQHERFHRLARPIVRLPAALQERADYLVEFTVHIICGNKQDLMTHHWPRFLQSRWPDDTLQFEVDARTHAGKPNIILVRQMLRSVREQEAITHCLSYAPSFRVKLDHSSEFRFTGERSSSQDYSDGITAFTMTRSSG